MSALADKSPQAAESFNDGGTPTVTPDTEARERQKAIAFKVSHVLLTVFFLWLTWVSFSSSQPVLTQAQDCPYHRHSLLCERLPTYKTCP